MLLKLFRKKASGPKRYVISDIHGCLEELNLLIEKLPLEKDSELIFLGDYIDRGPNSAQVIEKIINLSKEYKTTCLMGNHEKMFLDFLDDIHSEDSSLFITNGGSATLASYSDHHHEFHVPKHHLEFLKNLKIFHYDDEYIYVHAGLPDVSLEQLSNYKRTNDFLWIRKKFFKSRFKWGKKVIHGHTPVVMSFFSRKRINVDTGCVYGNKLTALELPSEKCYEVGKIKPCQHIYYHLDGSKRKSERFEIDLPANIFQANQNLKARAINFSETGTMLHFNQLKNPVIFKEGKSIRGSIGVEEKETTPFQGIIKRVQEKKQSIFLGIEFTGLDNI
jgi:serine/threonine protein phosphatase 1